VTTTQSVLDHHLQCFATGDLDGIMADFAPDAALLLPDGPLHGDCAFIVWSAETPDNRYDAAADTFLVRDGKIAVQTFAASVTPK